MAVRRKKKVLDKAICPEYISPSFKRPKEPFSLAFFIVQTIMGGV